ncbi:MAG: cation transporter dimerization domain-containing protein [Arcicella sp.]|nr:cation transporter dimerization domain-containing protein [Arcicella sp.]
MDEADNDLLEKVIELFQKSENWVDLHNLRIINTAERSISTHLTVPWYLNIHEAHREIDELSKLVKDNFGESIGLFVHTDGCLDFSCAICLVKKIARHASTNL